MIGYAIDVVKNVDGIIPPPMDLMLIGSVILAILTCQLTMTTGSCQGRLMVLQLGLEPLMEAYIAPQTNASRLFLT